MPFINSKISTSLTEAQETEIKTRLGQAIQTIPGKSESWLMVGFEPDYKLYCAERDACRMEHVISPASFQKLTELYQKRHPSTEPTENGRRFDAKTDPAD